MAKPYEEATERYLNTDVATSARELSAARGREQDTAVVDLVQRVQLFYAKADVSFTALFDPQVTIPQGQVTVRQIAALYPYDNQLLAIEGTGKMVKDALENAARFFSRNGMPGFNYDMAEGVDYQIDPSRPEGDRIRNLTWHGKPLAADQKLRIALNNYRAGGSGGLPDVPECESSLALPRRHTRPGHSLLHRTQNNPRESNRKLEAGELKSISAAHSLYFLMPNSDCNCLYAASS